LTLIEGIDGVTGIGAKAGKFVIDLELMLCEGLRVECFEEWVLEVDLRV